ncbi:MAG: hypothetical protein P4L16_08135 [Chlamydiales bacterium]|nr:hypothetical protein [Chlamydiales bacterium]
MVDINNNVFDVRIDDSVHKAMELQRSRNGLYFVKVRCGDHEYYELKHTDFPVLLAIYNFFMSLFGQEINDICGNQAQKILLLSCKSFSITELSDSLESNDSFVTLAKSPVLQSFAKQLNGELKITSKDEKKLSPSQKWKRGIEKARRLVGGGRLGIDVVSLSATYYQEALLDNSPYGRYVFERIEKDWKVSHTNLSLEEFIASIPKQKKALERIAKTTYCSSTEREIYKIEIKDGLMYQNGVLFEDSRRLCFVLGPDDELYVAPHDFEADGRSAVFKHSSFFSGKPIKVGGIVNQGCIKNGRIVGTITNKTAHYARSAHLVMNDLENRASDMGGYSAGPKEFLRLEKYFNKKGLDTSQIIVFDVSAGKEYVLSKFVEKAKALQSKPYFQTCNVDGAKYRLNTLGKENSFLVHPGVYSDYNILIKSSDNELINIPINLAAESFQISKRGVQKKYASIEALLQAEYPSAQLQPLNQQS